MSLQRKRALCDLFSELCTQELQIIEQASLAAKDAAINTESQAEDSHDTRATEASYLARGHAQRAEEMRSLITYFRNLTVKEFSRDSSIAVGAWVTLKTSAREQSCFLCERGGGQRVKFEGKDVQALSVSTPLGEAIVGARLGDTVEVESRNKIQEYEVIELV